MAWIKQSRIGRGGDAHREGPALTKAGFLEFDACIGADRAGEKAAHLPGEDFRRVVRDPMRRILDPHQARAGDFACQPLAVPDRLPGIVHAPQT